MHYTIDTPNFASLCEHDKLVKELVQAMEGGAQIEISTWHRDSVGNTIKKAIILDSPPASVITAFDHIAGIKRTRLIENATEEAVKLAEHADLLRKSIAQKAEAGGDECEEHY